MSLTTPPVSNPSFGTDKIRLEKIRDSLEHRYIRAAAVLFAELGKETQQHAFDLLCLKFRDKCKHGDVVRDGVDLVFDDPLRLLAPAPSVTSVIGLEEIGENHTPRIIDCLLVTYDISTTEIEPPQQKKSPNELFLDFYRGKGPNSDGLYFDNILDWNDDKLEKKDLCIPWLFPDEDNDDDNAPVFNNDVELVEIFRKGETMCRFNLTKAYYRILRFYGLEHKEIDGGIVVRIPGHKLDWLHRPHNFARISRILESLSTLGDNIRVSEFVTILEDIAKKEGKGKIPEERLMWWRTLARYG